ncbi:MAG TPA: NHLP leader peptide family RiPP precursor [Longimicrobiaceae bacterium]|nr:NHLP leader peptide family RiPP precursor [Longimicrobiaceae bacterium]
MSKPSQDDLLQDVIARATTDLVFRKRLLNNPETAIYDAFGVKLPGGQKIKFIEKPAGVDILIVLPDVNVPGQELDDEDLDAVAGGTGTQGGW